MKPINPSKNDGDNEFSFKINRKDIKVRKAWNQNPGTKVEPAKKKKREKDNIKKQIKNEQEEYFDW